MTDKLELTHVQLEGPRNGVVLIYLNRPQSGNSLHPLLLADAVKAIRWASQQSSINVIILSGKGRFFCTGMELKSEEQISFALGCDFHQINKELILFQKILIAAVNGPAIGWGSTCLASFDLLYSVEEAYFFIPIVKWGVLPEASASISFPEIMGYRGASFLFLSGERVVASRAKQMGFVNSILPSENFIEEVVAIAEKIGQSDSGAAQETKRLLKLPLIQDLLDANDRECSLLHEERVPGGYIQQAREKFKVEQEENSKKGKGVKASL